MNAIVLLGVSGALALIFLLLKPLGVRFASPPGVLLVYWAAATAIAALVFGDASPPAGSAFLLLCGFAFALGYASMGAERKSPGLQIHAPAMTRLVLPIGFIGGILSGVLTARANGIPVSLTSPQSVIATAKSITVLRYSGELRTPITASLALAVCFTACLAAHFVPKSHRRFSGLAVFLPLAGAAVSTILSTARTPFMAALFMTLSANIVSETVRRGDTPRLNIRGSINLLTAGLLGFMLFAVGFLTRYGSEALTQLKTVLSLYAVGSVPAFCQWITTYDSTLVPPSLGQTSFTGLFPAGQSAVYGFVSIDSSSTTNLFTAFRPLVEDFGRLPAVCLFFFFGVAAALAWRGVTLGRSPRASIVASCAILTSMLFSSISSVFSFTNVCLSFGLFALFLLFCRFSTNPAPSAHAQPALGGTERKTRSSQLRPRPSRHQTAPLSALARSGRRPRSGKNRQRQLS
ncbi:O-antigen polymerase [Dermacoccus nishinomiyaensis]|uniref:O-antigen polymerase n=1 Tax=Dermacoccus nishinomiyaensis TaxID=1274 RepID=UPI00093A966D|nr:O-antigen polymerase [Dermacoccus nishinomiyaensis]